MSLILNLDNNNILKIMSKLTDSEKVLMKISQKGSNYPIYKLEFDYEGKGAEKV